MEAAMVLAKHASGIYYVWYTDPSGKRRKLSTKSHHKGDALKFLTDFKKNSQSVNRLRFTDYVEQFMEFAKMNYRPRTLTIYRQTITHFKTIIGENHLHAITARHWDQFKSLRLAAVSPVTANIQLRALRALMNRAFRWQLIDRNPFALEKLCQVNEQLPKFFTPEDFVELYSHIKEQWLRSVVLFTALTGLRRAEVTNLRWENIDFTYRTASIISTPTFKTKQGRIRIIPLNDMALEILQKQLSLRDSEYVFSVNGKKLYDEFMSKKFKEYLVISEVGNKRLNFHSLRHSFTTWLLQSGQPIYSISKLLGHANVSTTQRHYAHLQPNALHDCVNNIRLQIPSEVISQPALLPSNTKSKT
jgi:integrase